MTPRVFVRIVLGTFVAASLVVPAAAADEPARTNGRRCRAPKADVDREKSA